MNNDNDAAFADDELKLMAALGIPLGVLTLSKAARILGRSPGEVKRLLKLGLIRRLGGPFCTIRFFGPYIVRLAADEKFAAKCELALNGSWKRENANRKPNVIGGLLALLILTLIPFLIWTQVHVTVNQRPFQALQIAPSRPPLPTPLASNTIVAQQTAQTTSGDRCASFSQQWFTSAKLWRHPDGRVYLEPPNHTVIVQVTIAGYPYDFMLDTGAEKTTMFSQALEKPPVSYPEPVDGIGGETGAAHRVLTEFKIDQFSFTNVPIDVVKSKFLEFNGHHLAGLLGQDVLCHFKVTVDYPNSIATLEYVAPQNRKVLRD